MCTHTENLCILIENAQVVGGEDKVNSRMLLICLTQRPSRFFEH